MTGYRRFAAIACLVASSGCSWITVAAPPKGPVAKDEKLTCTTSVAAPVTDTVVGALAIGGGGTALVSGIAAASCDSIDCAIGMPWAVLVATAGALILGFGVVEAFSAAHGYTTTADCRGLGQAQLACLSGVEASCAALRDRGGDPSR